MRIAKLINELKKGKSLEDIALTEATKEGDKGEIIDLDIIRILDKEDFIDEDTLKGTKK